MAGHTSDEGTLCGGVYLRYTCITFTSGKWVKSHSMAKERSYHTSWNNKEEGNIILMGGYGEVFEDSGNNTETITEGEERGVRGFAMKYDTW